MNLFDNYVEDYPDKLETVSSTEDVVKFMLEMFKWSDIQLFYDPSKKEPEKKEGEDDLYVYCQVTAFVMLFSVLLVRIVITHYSDK